MYLKTIIRFLTYLSLIITTLACNQVVINNASTKRATTTTSNAVVAGPYDLKITGYGYFILTNQGTGDTVYTRNGNFTIDETTGEVLHETGYSLQPSLTVSLADDISTVAVASDGSVTQVISGVTTPIGNINLAKFNNPRGLSQPDTSVHIYMETADSGTANSGTPGQNGLGTLTQVALNASNDQVDTHGKLILSLATGYYFSVVDTVGGGATYYSTNGSFYTDANGEFRDAYGTGGFRLFAGALPIDTDDIRVTPDGRIYYRQSGNATYNQLNQLVTHTYPGAPHASGIAGYYDDNGGGIAMNSANPFGTVVDSVYFNGVRTPYNTGAGVITSSESFTISITGDGYFRLAEEDGSTVYTLETSFTLDPNCQIVHSSGRILQPQITVPIPACGGTAIISTLSIAADGTVSIDVGGGGGVQQLGQLVLALFASPSTEIQRASSTRETGIYNLAAGGVEIQQNPTTGGAGSISFTRN